MTIVSSVKSVVSGLVKAVSSTKSPTAAVTYVAQKIIPKQPSVMIKGTPEAFKSTQTVTTPTVSKSLPTMPSPSQTVSTALLKASGAPSSVTAPTSKIITSTTPTSIVIKPIVTTPTVSTISKITSSGSKSSSGSSSKTTTLPTMPVPSVVQTAIGMPQTQQVISTGTVDVVVPKIPTIAALQPKQEPTTSTLSSSEKAVIMSSSKLQSKEPSRIGIIGPTAGEWKPVKYEQLTPQQYLESTPGYVAPKLPSVVSPDEMLRKETNKILQQGQSIWTPPKEQSTIGIIGPTAGEWKKVNYEYLTPQQYAEQSPGYKLPIITSPDVFLQKETDIALKTGISKWTPDKQEIRGIGIIGPTAGEWKKVNYQLLTPQQYAESTPGYIKPKISPIDVPNVMLQKETEMLLKTGISKWAPPKEQSTMGIIGPTAGEWKKVNYEYLTPKEYLEQTPGYVKPPETRQSIMVKSPADVFAPYVKQGEEIMRGSQPVEAVLGVKYEKPSFFYDVKQQQRDIADLSKRAEELQKQKFTTYENIGKTQQELAAKRDEYVQQYNKLQTQELQPWAKTIEQRASELQNDAISLATIKLDNTDENAVNNYNKMVTEYNKKQQSVEKDIQAFTNRQVEADKLLEQIKPYEEQITKLDEQRTNKLSEAYKVSEEANKALERIKSRDIFYAKQKKAESTLGEFRKEYTFKEAPIQRIAGEGLSKLEAYGFGVAETGRNIPEFLVAAPLREQQKEGIQKPTVLQALLPQVYVGKQLAKGIYNWEDPENVNYKWTTNINPKALSGGISTAVIGFGALSGAASGVTLPATATKASLLSTIGKIAVPTIVVGGTTVPLGVGIYKTNQATKQINEQIQKLESQKANINPKEYEATKSYLEKQKQNVQSQGMTVDRALTSLTKTAGEISAISALSIGAAKLAMPKTTIASPVRQEFEYGRKIQSEGGELGGGLTAKKVPIPEAEVPTKTPAYGRTDFLTYQEKPSGIWNYLTGKKIDTAVSMTPSNVPGGGYDIARVRQFGDVSYITTQGAGQSFATTKILDEGGQVLRTLKEAPLSFGQGVGAIPSFIQEKELYPRITKQLSDSKIYQQVGAQRIERISQPISKDLKIVGEMQYTTEAGKMSQARPTTIQQRQSLYQNYYTDISGDLNPQDITSVERVAGPSKWSISTKSTPLRIGDERLSRLTQVTSKTGFESAPQEYWTQFPESGGIVPTKMTSTVYDRGLVQNLIGTKIKGVAIYEVKPISFDEKYTQPIMGLLSDQTTKATQFLSDMPKLGKAGSVGGKGRVQTSEFEFPSTTQVSKAPQAKIYQPPKSDTILSSQIMEYTAPIKSAPGLTSLSMYSGLAGGVVASSGLISTVLPASVISSKISSILEPTTISKTKIPTLYTEKTRTSTASKTQLGTINFAEVLPATTTKSVYTTIPDVITKPKTSTVGTTRTVPSSIPTLPVLPAIISTGLLSAIPSIKMPTFGGWGGRLDFGQDQYSIGRRGSRSWIVSNPIAQYGEEFFARQQQKQIQQEPTMRDIAESAVLKGFGSVKALTPERASMITGGMTKKKKRWI